MPDTASIPATTPVVVPPGPQLTYDRWWLTNLMVNAGDPNKPVSVMAALKRQATLPDGTKQLHPQAVTLSVPDVFAQAEKTPEVAAAISQLLAAITAIGKAQGVL
jgi:hypothetical protein